MLVLVGACSSENSTKTMYGALQSMKAEADVDGVDHFGMDFLITDEDGIALDCGVWKSRL